MRTKLRLVAPSLILLSASCGTWPLEPNVVRTDLPVMPATAELDYTPLAAMAHAAMPVFDEARGEFTGSGRIWLKGSATCRRATITETASSVALEAPWYTAVVDAPDGEVHVEFESNNGDAPRSVRVQVASAAALNEKGRAFSALFFGDFQPFVVDHGEVRANPGPDMKAATGAASTPSLVVARRLFLAASRGLPRFPKPAFACGIGDQVYVEGDYHSFDAYEQRHPMSAWTVEGQPRPRVGLGDLPRFLDVCYRGYWSFPTFERALQTCPSLMMWDDHDIRDGWGSQGDESVYRDSYFRVFRDAFVAHQFTRGPRRATPAVTRNDAALWQTLAVGGVPMFVLDLRTCRDVSVPRVIGDEQWAALRQWFAALDASRCKHWVLVSPVPIFYRVADRANIASAFSEEARDDLLDTWTSEANEPEWQRLVAEIANVSKRGLRGVIVSGDYHVNSFCRITAARDGATPEVVAYEMIASGLAADGYSDWKQELAREGAFAETPIELPGCRLSTEFGTAECCAGFAGLEFADGEVAASIFQTNAEGCFQHRVPLTWSAGGESLRALVDRSRHALDPASFGR